MAVINPGILYVVATPLGNRDDITLRALNVLREVDLIAAEDTRKTRSLLTLHSISNNLISYHEHNEAERTPKLINKLEKGLSIALVSNAGTPMISDPGYRLIEAALDNRLAVIPIPGVSAATTALSVAGLPTDSFTFVGFLAKKKARRLRQINELASVPQTLIFYESPRRVVTLLTEIMDIMGNRRGVLAREMTKLHEEFIRGLLSEITDQLADCKDIRGECTLLIAGNDSDIGPSWPEVKQQIEAAVTAGQKSLSAIAREIASTAGIAKNRIYAEALRISKKHEL
ncbi:MAG: 16S rRNA (cytidine(1402)-2'-O)-methyltransferase [bacterium]|nr:16S rRNA (cytidine(1402)-2'-O)-methyltransferase [bacterium]